MSLRWAAMALVVASLAGCASGGGGEERVGALRLDRVFLYVQDMGKQVAFWRDTMGLPVLHPAGAADLAEEYFVVLDAGPSRLVLHGGGTKQLGKDAPLLSFHVADVKAERERLLARGVKLGEVRSPAPGVQVSDGVDPEGNRFSLDQW